MIRRTPRPETNWTVIRNEVIGDDRLSFKATGVLVYILSKPDHWQTSTAHLATVKKEGLDAIRTAMTELERAGYVKRRRYQDTLGRWKYDIDVFDSPVCNPVDNVDKLKPPHRDKPHGDNADVLVKTEQVKTIRELASNEIPMPRLCGQCHGIGKTVDTNDVIHQCAACAGAGIG